MSKRSRRIKHQRRIKAKVNSKMFRETYAATLAVERIVYGAEVHVAKARARNHAKMVVKLRGPYWHRN